MNEFKIGDTVRHKASGDQGPSMSVYYSTGEKIACTYWHTADQAFKKFEFHPNELVKSDPPKTSWGAV